MLRRPASIKLFELFGIRIGVDGSWFLILFLMIFWLSSDFRHALHSSDGVAYLTTVITVLVLFASLVVHELGHALAARARGITVRRIDLFLFGGLTQMSRDAETPGEDFQIAAAGPLATLGFVVLCLVLCLAIVGPDRAVHAIELDSSVRITPVVLSLSWLLLWNLLLLAFNLIPAFPLDGGRIARSIVWRFTGQKQRGTRVAAKLGQTFAVVLAGLGLWLLLDYVSFTALWLLAIAFLLWQSARAALVQTALNQRIAEFRVADVMDSQPVAIDSRTPVAQAIDEFFLRYGWSWFPVVDERGRFVGIVRRERLEAARERGENWLTVGSALEGEDTGSWRIDAERPLTDVLASESLGRLGAVMAVDREGVLRGVLTVGRLRRALQAALGSPTGP
ncbi:MAG: site-2 protease family protein [Solirubrobacterales bacterium]|nr:site-2 protease family protein [Solirubrobacterales bacterium]MBV9716163.1 site-2 protease family protein [Solirubrobacterales bacterium]